AQDKYLSSHKGQYAEAYAGRSPMRHRFDVRIAEDFAFRTGSIKHNFQVSVSIDNIGNMFNSNWGITKWSCYGTSDTMPLLKVESVSGGTPVYSVKKVGDAYPTQSFNQYYKSPTECWQLLVGLKYFFN
ncbi:MAG: TonB-dependent receptor, partial [Bacteroidales bacterium]|nr:TonB-dependent receptor [Bacteroidales bacterium]